MLTFSIVRFTISVFIPDDLIAELFSLPSLPAVVCSFIQVKVIERCLCLRGPWAPGECSYENPKAAWASGKVRVSLGPVLGGCKQLPQVATGISHRNESRKRGAPLHTSPNNSQGQARRRIL